MEALVLALVVGLTQVVKQTKVIANRYVPFLTLGLGILVSCLALKGVSYDAVVQGLIIGLSSMGLWSGTKAVRGK